MADENVVVYTTDWHLVADDTENSTTGQPSKPTRATALVNHILSAHDPIGCIDLGDNKDHYGAGTTTVAYDNYISIVKNGLPWLPINEADDVNATHPNLPGNHDEFYDYTDPEGDPPFQPYDEKFWGEPYHWTADWEAAKVRFIGIHAATIHTGDTDHGWPGANYAGLFWIDLDEVDWLEDQLYRLPSAWEAIICSHAPLLESFGGNIRNVNPGAYGGIELKALVDANYRKIAAYICGHRHQVRGPVYDHTIPYFAGGSTAYTLGNGYGTYTTLTYDPDDRTITWQTYLAGLDFSVFQPFLAYTGEWSLTLRADRTAGPNRLLIARP